MECCVLLHTLRTLQTSDALISRMSYVTETVEQELQLDNRLTPKLEFYVDTEPVLTAFNSMQLLEMKGIYRPIRLSV